MSHFAYMPSYNSNCRATYIVVRILSPNIEDEGHYKISKSARVYDMREILKFEYNLCVNKLPFNFYFFINSLMSSVSRLLPIIIVYDLGNIMHPNFQYLFYHYSQCWCRDLHKWREFKSGCVNVRWSPALPICRCQEPAKCKCCLFFSISHRRVWHVTENMFTLLPIIVI